MASYNAKGQLVSDDVSAWRNDDVYRTLSTYAYGSGANYALGAVTQVDAQNWKDGAGWPATQTVNFHEWWDGAVVYAVTHDPNINAAGANHVSTYHDEVIGGQSVLAYVDIADGRPRKVVFRSDMLGQVFRRDEKDNLSGGDPHDGHCRGLLRLNSIHRIEFSLRDRLRRVSL